MNTIHRLQTSHGPQPHDIIPAAIRLAGIASAVAVAGALLASGMVFFLPIAIVPFDVANALAAVSARAQRPRSTSAPSPTAARTRCVQTHSARVELEAA